MKLFALLLTFFSMCGTKLVAAQDTSVIQTLGSVLFASDRIATSGVGGDNNEIYRIRALDDNPENLTQNEAWDGAPTVPLSGRKIIFASWRGGKLDLYKMDIFSRQVICITNMLGNNSTASYSGDGKWFVFVSNRSEKPGWNDIYIAKDEQPYTPRMVTSVISDGWPCLNIDGSIIIYSEARTTRTPLTFYDIVKMNVNGSDKKIIAEGNQASTSPDDKNVVYVKPRARSSEIWMVNSDGTDDHRISPPGAQDDGPHFSPDGRFIVFDSDSGHRSARGAFIKETLGKSNRDIYIMNSDGSGVSRLTYGPSNNVTPSWESLPRGSTTSLPLKMPLILPKLVSATAEVTSEDAIKKAFESGKLIYASNNLSQAPYLSFVSEQAADKHQTFQLQSPRLQGTDGDFVFDPQSVHSSDAVLIKLGDPVVRRSNPYNSYRLWKWNRQTNALTSAVPRELFFRQVFPSPDAQRIAYIAGGNALGQTPAENGGIGDPLRLYVYDSQSQTETLVSDNEGVRGGFAWLDANTLLYTAVPVPEKTTLNPRAFTRPAIYAFDVATGKSTLLLNEARHPMPSPDGKRFAFWGLREDEEAVPLPDEWWQRTGFASLAVVERDGSGRKGFGRMPGLYPSLTWTPDNERLLIVGRAGARRGSIEEWNVVKGNTRTVAKIDAKDAESVERAWFQPQLRALNVAPDGKTLFVAVEEVGKQNQVVSRVQAVDLASGELKLVAELKDASGFDWLPVAP